MSRGKHRPWVALVDGDGNLTYTSEKHYAWYDRV